MSARPAYPSSVVKGIPRLGRKPDGWREVAFGDVLEVVKRPATIDPAQSYQLINVKRNRGGVIPRETKSGSEIKTKTQFYVAAEDFVISRRQIVHGACGIVPPGLDGALVSNEYSTLVPKKGLYLKFLAYFSHTSHFQKTCFHASVGVVIEKMIFNLDAWLEHRFYLPPLEEQERIVRILAAADRAIARTEDLIAAKRRLKKGLAQRLTIGKLRFSDFRESWTRRSLGSMGNCVSGGTPDTRRTEYWGGEHVWCIPSDIPNSSPVIRSTERTITDEGLKASSATLVPSGALIVCTRASVGESAITGVPLATNQGFKSLVFGEDVCPEFIYYSLVEQRHVLERLASGSTFREVSKRDFVRLELPVPQQIEEQQRIAAVLGCLDRHVELLQTKLTALREIKRGLMQRLFAGSTGKVKLARRENRNES